MPQEHPHTSAESAQVPNVAGAGQQPHRCTAGCELGDSSAVVALMPHSARAREPRAVTLQEPRWLMSSQYSTTVSCSRPAVQSIENSWG